MADPVVLVLDLPVETVTVYVHAIQGELLAEPTRTGQVTQDMTSGAVVDSSLDGRVVSGVIEGQVLDDQG